MEKSIFDHILRLIKHGALRVEYWDGDVRTYGKGEIYFTLGIHSRAALRALFKNLSLGFGEGYSKGLITVDGDLENVGRLASENAHTFKGFSVLKRIHINQRNTKNTQKRQIQHHYDIGNDFYKLWLDESMLYSCAYFKRPNDTLEQAQKQKIAHLLAKLQLSPDHKLLDIGCGWGTLLITAAKEYGASGLGITLSKEQLRHARASAKKAGVDKLVRFELRNFQDLTQADGPFDRIISVGMFEHVGRSNYPLYYDKVRELLVDGGITVLHTITTDIERPSDAWIDKYIFPGGMLPSVREIVSKTTDCGFQLTDYENLRIHYAMTLEEWRRRYNLHAATIKKKYGEEFYRMWDLWLASSAAGFRYGDLTLSQYVFTKGNNNTLPLTRDFLYKK